MRPPNGLAIDAADVDQGAAILREVSDWSGIINRTARLSFHASHHALDIFWSSTFDHIVILEHIFERSTGYCGSVREIAFRVWDRTAAAWHHFSLRPLDSLADLVDRDLDEASLTQSTGVKDKNGNDIFESDVLQDRLGNPCVVRFESARYVLTQSESTTSWPLSSDSSSHYEVVGNIIESPQLVD